MARKIKRVGLIGCGAIGRPVARALLTGQAGPHSLTAVLARTPRELDGFPVTASADSFFGGGHDLIIEAGAPRRSAASCRRHWSVARSGR